MRISAGLVLIAVSAALVGLSGATIVEEAAPFVKRALPLERRINLARGASGAFESVSLLESQFARMARLDVCLSTLREIVGSGASSFAINDAVTRGCLAIAEAIVARSPVESNVWFVAATLAARINDFPRTERFLRESYRTGPAEQWIAERRALFAYRLRDRFTDTLRVAIDGDFGLLLRTNRGLEVLATRYLVDPDIRDHLTGVAETLDRETQERFLLRLKVQAHAPQ